MCRTGRAALGHREEKLARSGQGVTVKAERTAVGLETCVREKGVVAEKMCEVGGWGEGGGDAEKLAGRVGRGGEGWGDSKGFRSLSPAPFGCSLLQEIPCVSCSSRSTPPIPHLVALLPDCPFWSPRESTESIDAPCHPGDSENVRLGVGPAAVIFTRSQ